MKIFAAIGWLALLAVALVGCGGGDGGGDDARLATPTPAATTAATPIPTATATAPTTPTGPQPSPGTLDESFGIGGVVVTDFAGRGDLARAVAVQPDGKVVVVGYSEPSTAENAFAVARYSVDGGLDPTFGDGGRVLTRPDPGHFTDATGVVIAADNAIIVSGPDCHLGIVCGGGRIARYDPVGRLDPSFGTAGIVSFTALGGLVALATQPDGRIVTADRGLADARFTVRRFRADGSADGTFGVDGVATIVFGEAGALSTLAIQADGKILVGGEALALDPATARNASGFVLMRLVPDGTLDDAFGRHGIVHTTVTPGQQNTLLHVEPRGDGTIVVAGFGSDFPAASGKLILARYRSDGGLDTSFGVDGVLRTSTFVDAVTPVLLEPDGAIVVGSSAVSGSLQHAVITRLTPAGDLDVGFARGGILRLHFRPDDQSGIFGLAVQPDGRLVVAGFSQLDGLDFAIGRLFLGP